MKNTVRVFFSLFIATSLFLENPKPFSFLAPRSSTNQTENLAFELSQIPPLPVSKEKKEIFLDKWFLLKQVLKDEDEDVCEAAVRLSLGPAVAANFPSAFELLEQALKHHHPDVRQSAASSLKGAIAANLPGAFELLKQALKDEAADVRKAAVRLSLGPAVAANFPGVFELLKQMLKDEDEDVREEAVRLSLGPAVAANLPSSFELLKQMLKDEDEAVRAGAASSLEGAIAANLSGAFELLKQALKDEKENVRRSATSSLGPAVAANFPGAFELLEQALKDKTWFFDRCAGWSLRVAAEANLSGTFELLEQAFKGKNTFIRAAAAASLGAAAAANLPGAFELFKQALKDEKEDVRDEAVMSLREAIATNFPGAFELLEQALKDEDEAVRAGAGWSLREAIAANFPGAFELLEQALKDEDGAVRRSAAWSLEGAIAANLPGAFELLKQAFKDEDEAVRAGAGWSLGVAAAANLPGAFELFKQALKDKDLIVRKAATSSLGVAAEANLPGAFELLKQALKDEAAAIRLRATRQMKNLFSKIKEQSFIYFVSEQQKANPFLKKLSFEKALSFLYFVSEDKGKNLFQCYYEKRGHLKPFEELAQLEDQLLWEGLHSFKDLFEEELQQDITLVETMTEFLQALQSRKMTGNFDFEVMQKVKSYLVQNKFSFKEFFNQVKEKEIFYEYLKFLNENKEAVFSLSLEWLRSKLSDKFFNAKVIHQIGEELLMDLASPTKKKEDQEVIFKKILQKMEKAKIWEEEDLASFQQGAEVFGYGALFEYLGSHENIHEALFQMDDILETYKITGLSKNQFLNNILFQVAKDKSVDYEGNNSYTRLNQCVVAFTEIEGDWRKLLEEEREITDPKFLKLKELLLEKNVGYKNWGGFEKLIQTLQMIQKKEVFKKIEKLKDGNIEGEKLYDYFSFLLFHPSLKNTASVEQFLEKPQEFLGVDDAHSVDQLHQAKKPSRYLEFHYIDLTGEELRDALVLGKLDSVSVFPEMKIDFYSYLDTEGLPILVKKMKLEWENWLLKKEIFEIAAPPSEARNDNTQTRIMPLLLKKGAQLKEPYKALEKELREGKLPKSLEWGFRNWVVEQYQTDAIFQKKVQKFFGGKGLGTKYTAQILAKSNPLAMVTGNECPSCMAFGSGKNNVYLFNPNVGIFVITKEVKELDAGNEVRDRAIVQSVLTMDRKISHRVNELKLKLDSALEEKNASNLDLVDFVGKDFLDKISQDTYIALDNREAATNFLQLTENGNNFQAWVDKLSTLFFQEYVKKNLITPAGREINQEFAAVGLGHSEFLGEMKIMDNYFLPQAPVPYSDKTGEQVGKLPIFEKSGERAIHRRKGVQKITFEDTLEVAFVENSVYKGFPENYKNHLAGIETELIAAAINEAVKGEKRKNLSRGYFDSNGKLLGYMIAYAGYDKAKEEAVIFVSDIAVLPEYQKQRGIGGKLLTSFARDAAKLNLPVIANLRKAKNGSYNLIKKWSTKTGVTIEESEEYEIAPGVQAIDVRIPTLKLPEKMISFPEPAPQLDLAI